MTRTKTRANANTPNNFVSVLDYGAVGDGITDDYQAIQQAINENNCVFLPPGNYRIKTQLVAKTKFRLLGANPQGQEQAGNAYCGIIADVEDLGDGNALLRLHDSSSAQSIIIENITFSGNLSYSYTDLSALPATGLVGVDVSGVKQGLNFINCAFRRLQTGLKAISGVGYIGHTTLDKCTFNRSGEALDFETTTGIGMSNCAVYDCYKIGRTRNVVATNCSFNNSSYSTEDASFEFVSGIFNNLWLEGFNRTLKPSKYLQVNSGWFSESYSNDGSTKFSISIDTADVTVELNGTRFGTNTRLVYFGNSPDITTINFSLKGCRGGSSFSSVSSLSTYLKNGLGFVGINNEQANYNQIFRPTVGLYGGSIIQTSVPTPPTLGAPKRYFGSQQVIDIDCTRVFSEASSSALNFEYAEFVLLGTNNGSGGSRAYFQKFSVSKGYDDVWEIHEYTSGQTEWVLSLTNQTRTGVTLTIDRNHPGSGDCVVMVSGTDNIILTYS